MRTHGRRRQFRSNLIVPSRTEQFTDFVSDMSDTVTEKVGGIVQRLKAQGRLVQATEITRRITENSNAPLSQRLVIGFDKLFPSVPPFKLSRVHDQVGPMTQVTFSDSSVIIDTADLQTVDGRALALEICSAFGWALTSYSAIKVPTVTRIQDGSPLARQPVASSSEPVVHDRSDAGDIERGGAEDGGA